MLWPYKVRFIPIYFKFKETKPERYYLSWLSSHNKSQNLNSISMVCVAPKSGFPPQHIEHAVLMSNSATMCSYFLSNKIYVTMVKVIDLVCRILNFRTSLTLFLSLSPSSQRLIFILLNNITSYAIHILK